MQNQNIYVASSWRNQYQSEVVARLREQGHKVYDFKNPEGGTDDSGGFRWTEVDPEWQSWPQDIQRYLDGLNHPSAVEGFRRDMDALMACDVCVFVFPCGVSASWEAGWAVGAGKRVYVYVPALKEPDLMVKMAGMVTADLDLIIQDISRWTGPEITPMGSEESWRRITHIYEGTTDIPLRHILHKLLAVKHQEIPASNDSDRRFYHRALMREFAKFVHTFVQGDMDCNFTMQNPTLKED